MTLFFYIIILIETLYVKFKVKSRSIRCIMSVEKIISRVLNISKFSILSGVFLFTTQSFFAITKPFPKPIPNQHNEIRIAEKKIENTKILATYFVIQDSKKRKPIAIKPKRKPGWPD